MVGRYKRQPIGQPPAVVGPVSQQQVQAFTDVDLRIQQQQQRALRQVWLEKSAQRGQQVSALIAQGLAAQAGQQGVKQRGIAVQCGGGQDRATLCGWQHGVIGQPGLGQRQRLGAQRGVLPQIGQQRQQPGAQQSVVVGVLGAGQPAQHARALAKGALPALGIACRARSGGRYQGPQVQQQADRAVGHLAPRMAGQCRHHGKGLGIADVTGVVQAERIVQQGHRLAGAQVRCCGQVLQTVEPIGGPVIAHAARIGLHPGRAGGIGQGQCGLGLGQQQPAGPGGRAQQQRDLPALRWAGQAGRAQGQQA